MFKDGFILYASFYEPIKHMTNQQLGKLFRAIFEYQLTGNSDVDDEILIAFLFIKNQLDLDLKKYKQTLEARSNAGKKGMNARWNKSVITGDNKNNNDITKDNSVITNDNKNNIVINEITNITDKEKDKDKDKDNVKEKEKEKEKVEKFKQPSLEDIRDYCRERNNKVDAQQFFDFYESKGWKVGNQSMKNWKACVRTWENRNTTVKKPSNTLNNNYSDINWDDFYN